MLALAGCATAPATSGPVASASGPCTASVYWEGFDEPLADNRMHQPSEILVAMPRPTRLGSHVLILNPRNGRSVVALVADRGPAPGLHRCVDLSTGAADALGFGHGIGPVILFPSP